jgi:hypothetical protein
MLLVTSNGGRFFANYATGRIDDNQAGHRPFEGIIGD